MTNGGADSDQQVNLLSLYGIVFEALRHEGNGIWQRFNIAVGISLTLFAGFGFVSLGDSRPAFWRGFAVAISLGGIAVAGWSCYVLRRLWERHGHWRESLVELQRQFPAGWVQPIDAPRSGVINLTEPYFWFFLVAWTALLVVLLACPSAFG